MRGIHYLLSAGIAAALAAPSTAAHSQQPMLEMPHTAQDLYYQCSSEAALDKLNCINYLLGVADMATINGSIILPKKEQIKPDDALRMLPICPSAYTGDQLRQIYVNYAKAHPESWQDKQIWAVWMALSEVWPCFDFPKPKP